MAAESVFRALSDATRQRLLRVLSAHELSVTDLVDVLAQPQSTISRHLKILREAELVVDRRTGAATLYSARPAMASGALSEWHGNGTAIREQLLRWAAQRTLEPDVEERLTRLMRRRRADSDSFFERTGGRWDQLRVEAFGDVFHFEALTLLLPTEWTVVDIGTGTGHLLPLLTARFRQVIAVDPSSAMLDAARARPQLAGTSKLSLREGTLERLGLKDAEADLAIASLVLHHLPDPQAGIAELRRCLRPGGAVLLIEQEEHQNESFRGRMGDHWWGFHQQTLERWLQRAGFADIRAARLTSARPRNRAGSDAPPLFAMTGRAPLAEP